MRNVSLITPGKVLLALTMGLLAQACSDDKGAPAKMDSGTKLDGGGSGEAGAPDSKSSDVAIPDMLPPGLDSGTSDAYAVDLPGPGPDLGTGAVESGSKDATSPPDAPILADTRPADARGVDATASEAGSMDSGLSALASRGQYLVEHVIACSDCHTPKLPSGAPDMSKYLAGNATFVKLPNGDVLPSRNLTPDKATGLGNYSADQIKHMFMDGIVPGTADGGTTALNSVMPYYVFHNMKSDDADAIVAYLQAIPPVNNPLPARSASFDVSAPSDYLDPATIPTPGDSYPQKDSALRGRYLATQIGLCIECHTEHTTTGTMPLNTSKFFQGGEDFSKFFVGTLNIHPVSANLTSDPTTGLGNWTAAQIVTVLKQGLDDQGTGICPPMPVGPNGAYGGLTDQDATDIANYIKSLPPAVNAVPDMCSWPPAPPVDGGSIDSGSNASGSIDSSAID
jgi:mono/diheme cytochrome c family protein